ncbi:MAG: hypothetical protein QM690_04720 [Sphingobium sp.]
MMRHGELTVIRPLTRRQTGGEAAEGPFMLMVGDDDGAFLVIGAQWVHERWAGAAPVEPSTPDHWRHVERLMLREAERRRHEGLFDEDHPMMLESGGASYTA